MNKKQKKARAAERCRAAHLENAFTASLPCEYPQMPSTAAIVRWYELRIEKHWLTSRAAHEAFTEGWAYANARYQDKHLTVIPDGWDVPAAVVVADLAEIRRQTAAPGYAAVRYDADIHEWCVTNATATAIYADEALNRLVHFNGRTEYSRQHRH